ncbi:MAG: SIMPL domain-containing protein [Firmicutes bacterium]|nr:SIMPL domain-containing protein [Bacillota bacterium]
MNIFKNTVLVSVVIASLALVLCTVIVSRPLDEFVSAKKSIAVTGSAKKQIRSDLAVWRGSFSRQEDELAVAYKAIKEDLAKVRAYLIQKGIDEKDIVFNPVSTEVMYIHDPETLRKLGKTQQISGYRMYQSVEVTSRDVDKITDLSREAPELIDQGVVFQSYPPQYVYTKLNDLKVDMLAEAAKDATARATKIAAASGARVGFLRSAKMGVFQITPLNSTEVSDYGINDVSSVEKEITAVVNAEFSLQ